FGKATLWVIAWVLGFYGNPLLAYLVQRHAPSRAPFAKVHQRFIHSDSCESGVKAGVALELLQVAVGFWQRLLQGVLGILGVFGYSDRETVDLPVVLLD